MFQTGNVQRITKYLLLCVLTLSSDCLASVQRVQNWGDDDNIYHFTTRRPYKWDDNVPTLTPTYNNDSDYEDRTIFFVVLAFGIIFTILLVYLCQKNGETSNRQTTTRVSGGTVHPPPSRLIPPTSVSYTPGDTRSMLSFVNTAFQSDRSTVDGRSTTDKPPDYATVAIGDLGAARESPFPVVVPKTKLETPPPQYQDGHPLK